MAASHKVTLLTLSQEQNEICDSVIYLLDQRCSVNKNCGFIGRILSQLTRMVKMRPQHVLKRCVLTLYVCDIGLVCTVKRPWITACTTLNSTQTFSTLLMRYTKGFTLSFITYKTPELI